MARVPCATFFTAVTAQKRHSGFSSKGSCMSSLKQAAEQALAALESCREGDYTTGHVIHPSFDEKAVAEAEAALRVALAKQPPVDFLKLAELCGFGTLLVETETLPETWVGYDLQALEVFANLVRHQALKEAWDAVNKTPGAEVRCKCMNGWATVKACADAIVALKTI